MAVVHFAFGCSAAGSLKQAIELLQLEERVVYLDDDLSMGPIDPPSPSVRAEWVADKLGYDHDDICERANEVLNEVASQEATPIAWFSRRCACEYAGFLELVWRRKDLPIRVVDVADFELTRDSRPMPDASLSFGYVHHDVIIAHRLRETAEELTTAARAAARATWERLRSENSALRVISPTGLVSAPFEHFDSEIVARVGEDWLRCARLVGELLGTLSPQSSDGFMWARICDLVDAGVLEGRGEFETYQDSWVRKPSSANLGRRT